MLVKCAGGTPTPQSIDRYRRELRTPPLICRSLFSSKKTGDYPILVVINIIARFPRSKEIFNKERDP